MAPSPAPPAHADSGLDGWRTRWLVAGPPVFFLTLFFVCPAVIMVVAAFQYPGEFGGLAPVFGAPAGQPGGLTGESVAFVFSDWIYAYIFAKSLLVAALTTLCCLLIGYPVALLIARSPKKSRALLTLLVVLPFASSLLIRVYAWMIILGPFDLLFTKYAVLLGLVYVHLPFMVLSLYANLEQHDPALLDAAQDLGANRWQRFWRVTWPLSLPGVWSGTALVFIPVLGVFAIPEILGGQSDVLIGNLIKDAFLATRDWPFGAALSIMLTLVVLVLAALTRYATRSRRAHA